MDALIIIILTIVLIVGVAIWFILKPQKKISIPSGIDPETMEQANLRSFLSTMHTVYMGARTNSQQQRFLSEHSVEVSKIELYPALKKEFDYIVKMYGVA